MTDLERRRTSFAGVAAQYERARPGYPEAAVVWLAERLRIEPGRDVLDLGAGTGKLTRQLVRLGARVVAVEPLEEMRAELERSVPGVDSLAATAEAIPLANGSVDAVTCGSAFHWFDAGAALREMHRVLRRDGGVGLVWNTRDESDPLQQEISALIKDDLSDDRAAARDVVLRSGLFGDQGYMTCPHEQWLSLPDLVDRVASTSFVASLQEDERGRLLDRIRALVVDVSEPIRFAYVTEAFAFARLDRNSLERGI